MCGRACVRVCVYVRSWTDEEPAGGGGIREGTWAEKAENEVKS